MSIRRVSWWLAGIAVVLACAVAVRGEGDTTWAGSSARLWSIAVAAAVMLVTSSVVAQRLSLPLVTWAAGAIWLLPDLAGIRILQPAVATLLDSTAWLLPALIVLTLSSSAGRPLRSRSTCVLALGGALGALGRVVATDPFLDPGCWHLCGPNPLVWRFAEPTAHAISWTAALAIVTGFVLLVLEIGQRLEASPAVLTAVTTACLLGLQVFPQLGPEVGRAVLLNVTAGGSAALLAVWLITDELRDALLRHRLAALAVELARNPAPGSAAAALRSALADPGLLVGYWVPERASFVDADGVELRTPLDRGGRVTTVTRSGRRLAVLVHSRAVDPAGVARSLGPALRLALENDQLRAALLLELRDVDESRRRILERSYEERRRLERNLHDSAQQRVVSLLLTLRMLAGRVGEADAGSVQVAAESAGRLLEELRRLARGIHPAVVADSGLAGALGDLAEHSTDMPIDVRVPGDLGLSALAQSTAYEFVGTAVADARAAAATSLAVKATRSGGNVRLQIDHDAVRSPETSDLDGVAVQAEALAGSVRIHGVPGRWQLSMELSCGS